MDIKELMKQHAYTCCLNWLLMVGILKIINFYYGLEIRDALILALPLVWVILIRCFDQNKKNIIPYIMIALVAIILFAVIQATNYPFFKEAKKYFNWLGTTLRYGASKSFIYSLITICIFLFCISIPCYLILYRYKLRLVVAIALFVILIIIAVTKQEISKLSVCSFLTYILMCVMEGWLNIYYPSFQNRSAKVMTFLLPFALLMTIVLLILPTKKEPIQWEFFKNCWKGITDMVEGWGDDIDLWLHPEKAEFSLNFAGYTEDGSVGGSLEVEDTLALSVELTTTQATNIYLMGNIKNDFNGNEWTYDSEDGTYLNQAREFEYDLYELAYALQREGITDQNYDDYFKVRSFNIDYQEITTKALFYPLKITLIQTFKASDTYQDKTANLRFDEAQGEQTRYRANYVQLNLGSVYLNQMINNQSQFTYQQDRAFDKDGFRKYLKKITMLSNAQVPENLEELLYQRSNYIKDHYLNIYDELPKRVSDLAFEITKDYDNDYDKLLALENFLSTYTYTTKPSQPPTGEDLIDYMLFESKEGYCTYYATAFAVMARCIGIPTRYVQGFCVDAVNQQDRYRLNASHRNAHAWAEAYIEGVGWLPFEPTPTYVDKRYNPWTTQSETIVTKAEPTSPVVMGGEEDEAARLAQELQNNERKLAYQSVIFVFICIIVVLFLAIPLYLLLKQTYRNKLYKEASTNQKVYLDICLLLSVFSYCERKIKMGETFCEYMIFVRSRFKNQEKNLVYLEQIFLRLRYNDEDLSQEEQKKVEAIRDEILKEVHDLLKKVKYLKMRVFLLQTGRTKGV
jgi:transglutaminase-like putative cysteine protease